MRWGFPSYVSVAKRKAKANKKVGALRKKGQKIEPIILTGRTIANTFWGKSWCSLIETFNDYENRLPRGRSYLRSGAVLDLHITKGEIKALVQGSKLYKISITIEPVETSKWQALIAECSGKIDSLIELLQGKFSKNVMEYIIDKNKGLFPDTHEISFNCSCYDYANLCKHVAAVLYGIGAWLDENPEQLFILRCVDHLELINSASSMSALTKNQKAKQAFEDNDLSALFDIDIDMAVPEEQKVDIKQIATTKAKKISPKEKTTQKAIVKSNAIAKKKKSTISNAQP